MHKKHVVFIVPDGVGIKNYLYSELLKYIGEKAKVTIWSPLPKSAFAEVRTAQNIPFQYKELKLSRESVLTRLYREAASFARLCFNAKSTQNETIRLYWRRPKGNFKLGFLYSIAQYIGFWAKFKYSRILKLERLANRYWSSKIIESYASDLIQLEADSIFITHQRVPGLMPICKAAQELNIKSITAIFSWDNLPKARLCVNTDFYLLWSDWMKRDMDLFYPEIKSSQLKIVGTPQFEFYRQKERLIDRKSFAAQHGLNHNCQWICFSGDDEYTSPYDPNYLLDIAESMSQLDKPVQLIFRRCPVDFSSRYDAVLEKYKEGIISIDPIWHTDSLAWVGYFSKLEDINLQVNLAYHCETVINLGSTMAIDFAVFNKPCLYLNYDTVEDKFWSTNVIYKFHHFRSMRDLDAVGWINKKSEIKDKIEAVLNNKASIGSERKLWLERIVLTPLESNAEKIANTIL